MTDYQQVQTEELAVLQSIYFEEYEEISTDPGEFTIRIESEEKGAEDICTLKLHIKYTETYPDELPEYSIDVEEGSLDQEDLDAILKNVAMSAEASLGDSMVFNLVAAVNEKLTVIIDANKERRESEEQDRVQRELEEEQRKKQGTKVTPTSFLNWKTDFDAEMAEKERLEKGTKKDPKILKPTGRQLFERDHSLAKSDATFMEEGDEDVDVTQFVREENVEDEDDEDDNDVLRNIRASG
ncbi:RWD domain-containing protein 1 [Modicella reniformis]|uniref:RWD domain-containing protein 1 n=1 Tax=Modicella reniformis TaxID=1440133 RepID=A0A9P6LS53_9FUNG|nr:RWD domain-containing protein 1 [Modicella reniformis]